MQIVIMSVVIVAAAAFAVMAFSVANEKTWRVVYHRFAIDPHPDRVSSEVAVFRALTARGAVRQVRKLESPNDVLIVKIEEAQPSEEATQ